jgi:Carboxypeptidase regulatory-like domain
MMRTPRAALGFAIWSLVCLSLLCLLCVPTAIGQSAGTGAISGTVTDPSGRSVPNATVTATNLGTGQARTATTGSAGDFKFSLLTPGNYQLKFTASGFKTSEVGPVTVNVTETATANQTLEVGAVSESVTVEANIQTLQTESSTLGTTVTGSQINALPMANGNYTEILSLSSGTSASVDNATSVGKGTQDISANGVDPGSNNFQMDGVAVNNIANSGSANDGTIYTGIPIPSTDAIAEFKVQTSTYDASYGRNPGANVTVSTKSGTNAFHGSAFEFLRNSVLNADDFFYIKSAAAPHQVLDQNQFGATIGGPIKKDKLFFFFSYRGTRGKNGVAPQGETFGAVLPTTLNGTTLNPTEFEALGSRGTCPAPPAGAPETAADVPITSCSAAAQAFAAAQGITNIVGLRIFQLQTGKISGVPNNYYIPAPATDPQFCNNTTGICNFSVPAIYSENQYVANGDYIINSKHTLTTKYFYTANPQTLYLGQGGGNLPGTPEKTPWGNQAAVAKLTSTLTNTFVNEARVSYQRNNGSATVTMPVGGCPTAGVICGSPAQLGMQPLVPGFNEGPTMIDVLDNYSLFGGLLPFKGPTNQLQAADQISWSRGKHSIRAGYEYEWTNWPLQDQGLQQGLLLLLGDPGLAAGGDAGPVWNVGCLFCVKGITGENGITHFYHVNNQDTYVLDDWKVSSRLTINVGLRWEYDGLLSDSLGRLSQVWINRLVPNSDVPPAFSSTNPAGIEQYVVPSNFAAHFPGGPPAGVLTATNRNSTQGHAPYSDFAPRLGFAWQPLSGGKLVVRGGVGIFYDREGLDRIVHAFEQGYPYAATYDFGFLSPRWAEATLAKPYPSISLVCMPSDPNCNTDFGLGFAPRYADAATGVNSGLSTPYDPTSIHTPLVQEYSFGIQYQFVPQWVLEVGYVGSTGINLTDYNHNHNQANLVTPATDVSGPNSVCAPTSVDGGPAQTICNTSGNAAFRVPYLGYEADGLQASDNDASSNYNSLQVTVRHQFSHGLSMQAAYTWSRDLTDVFNSNSANINNSLNLRAQYGPASYSRDQRLVVNYSYDLPFGKGTQGIEGKLVSGWNVSGVTIAQSGDFLTFIDPGALTIDDQPGGVDVPPFGPGDCSPNPNCFATTPGAGSAFGTANTGVLSGVTTAQFCPGFGNAKIKNPGGILANLNHYFNPGAFNDFSCKPAAASSVSYPYIETDPNASNAALGYGNSGVGAVTGPGQFNWDISILKNTQITERVKMQFRADFYNAFNHPQFADPGAGAFGTIGFENITTPTYGAILHTNVNPRLIQFGLHFTF